MTKGRIFLLMMILAMATAFWFFFTIFVIQPIGAIPEGRTVLILRLNKTNFIDSADAMCERQQGGVSLMCRAMTASAVISKTTVIARFPYSSILYKFSTNGAEYDR